MIDIGVLYNLIADQSIFYFYKFILKKKFIFIFFYSLSVLKTESILFFSFFKLKFFYFFIF
jgi:hypothetical protein